MSNSSTVNIACALCVGGARELYLDAALEAIAGAVDQLAVNDNSGLARSDNLAVLERSAFAGRGALHVRPQPFSDFADMRNRAFAQLAALPARPDWVLFLDADEIHGEQVRYIAREILPRLSPSIGHVDAYTYHFFGTYGWITDVARRFAFYRYSPELRWVNAVHEKIEGLRGGELVLPYVYYHYGNVVPPAMLARKHGRYFELGNPVPRPPDEADATLDIYLAKAAAVRPFRGAHPAVARPLLQRLGGEFASEFAALDAGFRARRGVRERAGGALREGLEGLRVQLRRLEHPGLYRGAASGR
jgi:hypothetical protein